MKANELMVRDWVYCFDPDEPDDKQINKVSAIRLEYNEEAIKFEPFSDWFEEGWFAPIPLTAEILEKNGLDKVPELSMVLNRDTMPLYHAPMLHYVHELQHALRLCGLTELADNFKVE